MTAVRSRLTQVFFKLTAVILRLTGVILRRMEVRERLAGDRNDGLPRILSRRVIRHPLREGEVRQLARLLGI